MVPAAIHRIERNNICRQTHIRMSHRHWQAGQPQLLDAPCELLHHVADHWLEVVDIGFRKKRRDGCAAQAVVFIVNSAEAGAWKCELCDVKGRFVAGFVDGVQLFVVVWLVDVQLGRADSDYWS